MAASPRLRLDLVANNLVGWAVTEGVIRILSDGTPWRPLIHVEDMARAIGSALEAPADRVCGHAFNTGRQDANYQVKDIAAMVAREIPCQVTINPDASPDTRSYRVDFRKIQGAMPGFRPEWALGQGIAHLKRCYLEHRLDREAFQGRRFTRLLQLKQLLDTGRLGHDLRWTEA